MAHLSVNIVYVLFYICIFKNNVNAQWVYEADDDNCTTPDGEVGDCVPIKRCSPIIDFLRNTPKPLSQNVITRLNSYACGFQANTVKVCCPSGPVVISSPSDNMVQPSGGVPPPPDVSKHRNYNLLPGNCGYLPLDDKITNGETADLNEFPWMALLSYRTSNGPQFRCGGSIINDRWILTAAHCVTALKSPLLGVRTGEYNIQNKTDCVVQDDGGNKCSPPVQDLAIEEVRVHPQFNLSFISNDIALLKVTRMNLNVENVRPVCLPLDNTREANFSNVVVTGWGITDSGQSSNVLQKVSLPVVGREQCQAAHKVNPRIKITYKQICAGGREGKDSCSGDSGGPLQVAGYLNDETRYVQQGIVSFGPRQCGLEGFPGVYTRIAYYMDWILDTIGS